MVKKGKLLWQEKLGNRLERNAGYIAMSVVLISVDVMFVGYLTLEVITASSFMPGGPVIILFDVFFIAITLIWLTLTVNNLISLKIFERGLSVSIAPTETDVNWTVKEIFIPWKDIHRFEIRPFSNKDSDFRLNCERRNINLNDYTKDVDGLIELLKRYIPEIFNAQLTGVKKKEK
jgi:hypothetical protein